jgi:hypothetical protein
VILERWAARWQLPPQALEELRAVMGVEEPPIAPLDGMSEAAVQQQVRLEASKRGARLWRNNNGAATDAGSGRVIRYGLANDSAALSKKLKSSDLIGITPHTVRPEDIGRRLGVFTSYEVKRSGWKYAATAREVAQAAWIALVVSLGGIAKFVNKPEDLY